MAPAGSTERDIGALQAAVQALTDALRTQATYHERMMEQQALSYNQALADLKATIAVANESIEGLQKELASVRGDIREAKGSWKMLVGLATVSAVFGGTFVKIVTTFYPMMPR
jgi:chromosome segregation ATPase